MRTLTSTLFPLSYVDALAEFEKSYIEHHIRKSGYDMPKAAMYMQIPLKKLERRWAVIDSKRRNPNRLW